MKIFVSSLITGMEAERAAVVGAVRALGHDAVTAETFGARAESPQVACLAGVRGSDCVVLVLGDRYAPNSDVKPLGTAFQKRTQL
ncbi:MAG: DUF4062 domain-containing protein [Proteobacteria bacterium]|nr:DUF4062 domain-containing protein [Pseudomonadota bacterium]